LQACNLCDLLREKCGHSVKSATSVDVPVSR